jgi:rubrerythrin
MTDIDADAQSHGTMERYVQAVRPASDLDAMLDIVRDYAGEDLPLYTDALRAAFAQVEPVFTRDRYSAFFWNCATSVPDYMPRVVLANGAAESEGSAKLLELWSEIHRDETVASQVMVHAQDESRHARIFLRMTELAFPGTVGSDEFERFERSLPDVRNRDHRKAETELPEEHIIDNLVQMNIGEIRTRLHMHLFAPIVYGMTPDENKRAVQRLFEGLVRDEVRHIGYTARLMERWAENGARRLIADLYAGRLDTFNRMTYEQTESAVRDYGKGLYDDLRAPSA